MEPLDVHRRLIGTVLPSFSQEQVRRRVRRDAIDSAYELADDYGIPDEEVDAMVDQRLRRRMSFSTMESPGFGRDAGYDRDELREIAAEVAEMMLEQEDDYHTRSTVADLLNRYGLDPSVLGPDADIPTWGQEPLEKELAEEVLYADDRDELYARNQGEDGARLAFADPDAAVAALDERIEDGYDTSLQTGIGEWSDGRPSRDAYERVGVDWFTDAPAEIIDGFWEQD